VAEWLTPYCHTQRFFQNGAYYLSEFEYEFRPARIHCERLDIPVIADGWLKVGTDSSSFVFNKLPVDFAENFYATLENLDDYSSIGGEFSLVKINRVGDNLTVISDSYATRPVYYWKGRNSEIFISNSLSALFLNHIVPFEINPQTCSEKMTSWGALHPSDNSSKTYFTGISKLPPSSVLHCAPDGNIVLLEYWNFQKIVNKQIISDNVISIFRSTIIETVSNRLAAGATLIEASGGLDSSALIASAVAAGYRKKIFAIKFSLKNSDNLYQGDQQSVKKLLQDLKVNGAILYIDDMLGIANAELGRDEFTSINGPDFSTCPQIVSSHAALMHACGAKSIMAGYGGDGLLHGSHYILDSLIRQRRFDDALKLLCSLGLPALKNIKTVWEYGIVPFLPVYGDRAYNQVCRQSHKNITYPAYFTDRQHNLELSGFPRTKSSGHKRLKNWSQRIQQDAIWPPAAYVESLSSVCSHSFPYYDKRMIEACMLISPEKHYNVHIGGYAGGKQLLRTSLMGILPGYIIGRYTKMSPDAIQRLSLSRDKRALLDMFNPSKSVMLEDLAIIRKGKFYHNLVALIMQLDDPNFECLRGYTYTLRLIAMEIWLREVSQGREYIINRTRPRKSVICGELTHIK